MAYTTISELTLNPANGSIEHGEGFFEEGHTFFYLEDIQKVLEKAGPNDLLSQLKIVNIVFRRNDGDKNHNIHNVKGLALAKSAPQFDAEGKITNTDWHENVALAWPPYYIRGSVTSLEDKRAGNFNGVLFEGSSEYVPGLLPLKKSEEI